MADRRWAPTIRFESAALERRSAVDRRSGQDRRTIDLWRETGRSSLDLRSGVERRSGEDRRRSVRRQRIRVDVREVAEIVTPWQIPEPRHAGR